MNFFEKGSVSSGSSFVIGTVITVMVATGTVFWTSWWRNRQSMNCVTRGSSSRANVPWISSWIPYIGCAGEYFSSVILFMTKYHAKYNAQPCFGATILGKSWYFVSDPDDIRKLLRAGEKSASLYQAVLVVSSGLFPTEYIEGKNLPDNVKQFFRGAKFEGLSATPLYVHALKQLPAWLPQLQEAFQYNFRHMVKGDSGTQNLFEWISDLIALATARVMLGGHIGMDVVKEWVELVKDCDLEGLVAGRGALDTVKMILEVKLHGERKIYRETRQFIYPYVDKEIDDFLANDHKPQNSSVISSLVAALYKNIHLSTSPDDEDARDEILRLSKLRIANDLIFFTFAAITNSFGTASWALFHILRNTERCGDRIRDEISSRGDDLSRVSTTLESLILEITRLYIVGNTFRMATSAFQLESDPNIIFPQDSLIAFNSCILARLPSVFPNPTKFNPARFDPSNKDYKVDNFYGFGFGAHPCVGRRFAVSEVAIFVSEALKTFDFELVESDTPTTTTKDKAAIDLTESSFPSLRDHPTLDPTQIVSVWRPIHPVYVKYQRKQNH